MNATEKRQIKRENEGHVWHFFAFSPKFWFLSFGGLFARRINFKKSPHFTKSSFTRIALQRTPKQTPCGASLSSSSLTSQKIYDIVLVTLEYRCLSRFSRSRRGRLGTLHATGKMLFFFPLLFLPLLFPRRISLTSLSLSLSLCYRSEIVHIQAGQCGNQIGAKFWEVSFSRVKQLCSFLSFDDDDEHHFPFFSLPVG
mgnify:CR=1 FL=1